MKIHRQWKLIALYMLIVYLVFMLEFHFIKKDVEENGTEAIFINRPD